MHSCPPAQFNRPRAAPLLFEAFLDRFSGLAAFTGTLSFKEDGGCARRVGQRSSKRLPTRAPLSSRQPDTCNKFYM